MRCDPHKLPAVLLPNFCPVHKYRPEILEPAPSLFRHQPPIGGIQVFPAIQIAVIHQVHMYCSLSMKINTCEMLHGAQRLWTHFNCICFCLWSAKKPKYPNFSYMADDAISRSDIGVLGSPVYICGPVWRME